MKLDFDIETKGEHLDFELKDTKVINTGGGVSESRVVQIVEEKTKELQPKTDESLKTESKQVSGAINEVNSGLVKGINSSITEETNELVLELKNKDGTVLFSTKVQLPKSELPDLSAFVKASDFLEGAGAPTTATVSPFVGALYLDTTNNNTYQCTAIDEATPSYTWVKLIRETDYATKNKAGVVKVNPENSGLQVSDGGLRLYPASPVAIELRNQTGVNYSNRFPIALGNLNIAVIASLTDDKRILMTDEEKAKACETLGVIALIEKLKKDNNLV